MTGLSKRKAVSTGKKITALKFRTIITEIHRTTAFTPQRNNKNKMTKVLNQNSW
jgi:hypothetical protein